MDPADAFSATFFRWDPRSTAQLQLPPAAASNRLFEAAAAAASASASAAPPTASGGFGMRGASPAVMQAVAAAGGGGGGGPSCGLRPTELGGLEELFQAYGVRYYTAAKIAELGFTVSTLVDMKEDELDDMMSSLSQIFRWELLVGERYGIKAAVRAERRRIEDQVEEGRRRGHLLSEAAQTHALDALSQEGLSEEPVVQQEREAAGSGGGGSWEIVGGGAGAARSTLSHHRQVDYHHDQRQQQQMRKKMMRLQRHKKAGSSAGWRGGRSGTSTTAILVEDHHHEKELLLGGNNTVHDDDEEEEEDMEDRDHQDEDQVEEEMMMTMNGGAGVGMILTMSERQREHPFIVTEPGEVARGKKNGLDYLFHLYELCRDFLVQVQNLAKERGEKCPTKVTNQVFRYAKKAGATYINKPKMRHYVHCYALHCLDEDTSNTLRRAFKERGENVGAWRQACYKPLVAIAALQGWDIDAIFNAHPRLSIWYVPTKLRQLCHAEHSAAVAALGSSSTVSATVAANASITTHHRLSSY